MTARQYSVRWFVERVYAPTKTACQIAAEIGAPRKQVATALVYSGLRAARGKIGGRRAGAGRKRVRRCG